ncbi:dUTP diphosphatase [Candidatus Mycoplasma pogonae]
MKLDLTEIFISQKQLDETIQKTHNIKVNESIIDKQIIALIVEIAEFANEIKTFKYWKKDLQRNEQKVLEEYADVMHFFISLSIKSGISSEFEIDKFNQQDINKDLLKIFSLINQFSETKDRQFLQQAFIKFLEIAQWLNYDYPKIVEEYYKKLQINFERILNNY